MELYYWTTHRLPKNDSNNDYYLIEKYYNTILVANAQGYNMVSLDYQYNTTTHISTKLCNNITDSIPII